MANREEVFSNLREKFRVWLSDRGIDPDGAGAHYRDNLEVIGEPIRPHNSPTGKWYGLYELLTGDKPKSIYSVTGTADFAKNYGKAISFFTVSKSYEDKRNDIHELYPRAANFDELYDFAYINGDNGHTRNGFVRYLQFLYELESQVTIEGVNALANQNFGPRQRIFYGAPGTGKSHGVNETAKQMPKEDVVRTTFHPDSDYSTFVGAYKPKVDELPRVAMDVTTVKKAAFDQGITPAEKAKLEVEKKISYEFVPQAFAKAYLRSWKRLANPAPDGKIAPVMLVIEEINRGDCAKVFGDLFQLLDRRVADDANDPAKKAGFSEYPVLADSDFADYIRHNLTAAEKNAIGAAGYASVVADENLELILPANFYIWATMNTSDQSLFPMDSAFKRRWNWKYVPIKDEGKGWKIKVGHEEYDWWSFLNEVNKVVEDVTSSEDKKLGYFFVKTADGVVGEDVLVNKVVFFLWNDVFKDISGESRLQMKVDEKETDLKFHHFFKEDGTVNSETITAFFGKLKVKTAAQVAAEEQGAAGEQGAEEVQEAPGEPPAGAEAEAPAAE